MRSPVLFITLALSVLPAADQLFASEAKYKQPNVLFILSDDHALDPDYAGAIAKARRTVEVLMQEVNIKPDQLPGHGEKIDK